MPEIGKVYELISPDDDHVHEHRFRIMGQELVEDFSGLPTDRVKMWVGYDLNDGHKRLFSDEHFKTLLTEVLEQKPA